MCVSTSSENEEERTCLYFVCVYWATGGRGLLCQLGFLRLSLCGEGPGFITAPRQSGEEDHLTGPQPAPLSGTPHARAHFTPQHMSRMIVFAFTKRKSLCVQDTELDYECVLVIEGQTVVVDAYVETDDMNPSNFDITCQLHQV